MNIALFLRIEIRQIGFYLALISRIAIVKPFTLIIHMTFMTSLFTQISRQSRWLGLGTAILLSGCASQQIIAPHSNWAEHQAQLQQLTAYQARGDFGYISPEQRFSTGLFWQKSPEQSQLQLTSLFGTTLLKLQITPQGARLIDNKGQTFQGKNAAELVQRLTGLQLPINQMQDWLIGLPTGADHYTLNTENQVQSLTKVVNGQTWTLQYLAYDDSQQPPLPTQMRLTQGNTKINIQINHWAPKGQ